ncbi:GntR family transcriptional regulator [Corynebacterium sp. A21]|uniref:GntR family transcriptional regulator n=1 Tax=Corynebacterium sp. A21 TaxID=3457318 RepID=UPI003FD5CD49
MEHLPPLGTPDNPAHSGQEIAEVLTAEIRHLQPGAQLPTEHELMSRFGAKRAAVRTALESLEARLLIKRVRGIGTFVNDRFDYLLSSDAALLSLHEVVQPTGALSEMRVISVDRVPLPEHQAQRFNVTDNSPLLRLTRIGSINGVESIHTQTLLLHPLSKKSMPPSRCSSP